MVNIKHKEKIFKLDPDSNTKVFVSHPSQYGMEKQYMLHSMSIYAPTEKHPEGQYKVVFSESEVNGEGGRYDIKPTDAYDGEYDPTWGTKDNVASRKIFTKAINQLMKQKHGIEPLEGNGKGKPEYLQ